MQRPSSPQNRTPASARQFAARCAAPRQLWRGSWDRKSGSSIALRQSPQNFLEAAGKTQATQDQRENQLGVQPAIQKITEHAAKQHGAHNGERQLHGQRRLRRIFLRLRYLRRFRVVIRRFVHGQFLIGNPNFFYFLTVPGVHDGPGSITTKYDNRVGRMDRLVTLVKALIFPWPFAPHYGSPISSLQRANIPLAV